MWIASCTKLITSVSALRCVERGQVTLDEPLGKHLPELADPQVVALDESAPGGFTLRPAKNPITLRTLLTHTSGIAYEWGDPRLAAWRKAQPEVPAEKKGLMHVVYNIPLLFDPGEGWVYGGKFSFFLRSLPKLD
jgi:CubicO group peptidase (beta-lactamase class C family)